MAEFPPAELIEAMALSDKDIIDRMCPAVRGHYTRYHWSAPARARRAVSDAQLRRCLEVLVNVIAGHPCIGDCSAKWAALLEDAVNILDASGGTVQTSAPCHQRGPSDPTHVA